MVRSCTVHFHLDVLENAAWDAANCRHGESSRAPCCSISPTPELVTLPALVPSE